VDKDAALLGIPPHVMPRGDVNWASRFFIIEIEEAPLPQPQPLREDATHRQAAAATLQLHLLNLWNCQAKSAALHGLPFGSGRAQPLCRPFCRADMHVLFDVTA
jgi:hypothetical protein